MVKVVVCVLLGKSVFSLVWIEKKIGNDPLDKDLCILKISNPFILLLGF